MIAMDWLIEAEPVTGAAGPLVAQPGPARWYALLARPVCEQSAVAALQVRGVQAGTPVQSVWERSRRVAARKRLVHRRLLPGYVFARFGGVPDWHGLFAVDPLARYLRGVVGMGGVAVPLSDRAMRALAEMPAALDLLRRRALAQGQRVRVTAGALEGCVVEVDQVDAGLAQVLVPLLGGRTTLPVEWLDGEGGL